MVHASSTETPIWTKTERYGHECETVLQFNFHDVINGDSPTVELIAQAKGANQSAPTAPFGNLYMVDDPLTLIPDPNSTLVGRAQGIYGTSAQEGLSLIMVLALGFVDGSSVVIFWPELNHEHGEGASNCWWDRDFPDGPWICLGWSWLKPTPLILLHKMPLLDIMSQFFTLRGLRR